MNRKETVSRVEVLEKAKSVLKNSPLADGLCIAIESALHYYKIYPSSKKDLPIYFPKFKRKYALMFGGIGIVYWWWRHGYTKCRVAFLNWLIKKYKDDPTDLFDVMKEIQKEEETSGE